MTFRERLAGTRVFIDSSAFFAVIVEEAVQAPEAALLLHSLYERHVRLYTSNFVVAETHALILSRENRAIALRALNFIDASEIDQVRVTEGDERRARAIIEKYEDKTFSLTDATSFAVMERLGIAVAFTFDSDFEQFGFVQLRAPR